MLDKIDLILDTVADQPCGLAELAERTGVPRPTTHRLCAALIALTYLAKDDRGRYVLGPRITALAGSRVAELLVYASGPVLQTLRDETAASAQLYRRQGDQRICIASVEPLSGLRDSVPAGTSLPMTAGSAAQVLLAWEAADDIRSVCGGARFGVSELQEVRAQGWAHSVGEREAGLASVSAPVRGPQGGVVAAVSVSGPIDRIAPKMPDRIAAAVMRAAGQLESLIGAHVPGDPLASAD